MKHDEANQSASVAWLAALGDILSNGRRVAPRGKMTLEIPQRTMVVDMRRPVVTVPERSLSYRFMAAEAFWILTGDDRVETIAPYNSRIAQFSDDGVKFFGAYGPKVLDQLMYVVNKLKQDPDTRQAGMTIWRENPPDTKDVPCTVAAFFNIRGGHKLNAHVFMRSSDAWLGVPYDVFNFSMLAHLVCGILNEGRQDDLYEPGTLYLTAASSHLYEVNWDDAKACTGGTLVDQPETPAELWTDHTKLIDHLRDVRETRPGDALRWWELK